MDFLNDISKRISGAARSVQEKTRDSMELTRLGSEIRSLNAELDRLYGALGRAYYDAQAAGDPDNAVLTPFIEQIEQGLARLEALIGQRDRLRQQRRCPSCNAVQSLNAKFCANCGARLPEAESPAEQPRPDVEYCPECGALRKKDAAFCPACGKAFGETSAPQAEPEITWPGPKPDVASDDEAPKEESQE